jgi:hypothetical protein
MTPPKTPSVLFLRIIVLAALSGLGVWGMLTGVPFQQLSPAQVGVLGYFRAVYGLLACFRILRAMPNTPLVFGWEKAPQARLEYWLWMVAGACITAGFLTPLALLCHWLLGVRFQRTHRTYSVEDVLNRQPGLCLLFMNSHLGFSADHALGWTYGLVEANAAGVNFYCWTFCVVMFSTGFEKVWSPVWQRGLGFYQFVSIPFVSRPLFRKLRRFKWLCLAAGWGGLALELGLMFCVPWLPVFRMALLSVISFGLVLTFGPTSFFFVGAPTVWAGAFIFGLLSVQGVPVGYEAGVVGWLLIAFYVAGCVSVMNFTPIRGGWMAWLMERTTYMRPYILFNEVHFFGLYIYRVIAVTPQGRVDTIQAFTEDGEPGPIQFFRPVAIYATFTRVTDYCIALLHDQTQRLAFYGRVVADLGQIGLDQLSPEIRQQVISLHFEVRVYDPPADYDLETSPWRSDWVEIGHYDLSGGSIRFIQEGAVPHYGKTARWPVLWN